MICRMRVCSSMLKLLGRLNLKLNLAPHFDSQDFSDFSASKIIKHPSLQFWPLFLHFFRKKKKKAKKHTKTGRLATPLFLPEHSLLPFASSSSSRGCDGMTLAWGEELSTWISHPAKHCCASFPASICASVWWGWKVLFCFWLGWYIDLWAL